MTRVMAIDYGRKRIGVAVTDETRLVVTPLSQLYFNRKNSWHQLFSVIQLYSPKKIIIGDPNIKDSLYSSKQEILDFKRHLEKLFPQISFCLFDESYSSKEAEAILSNNDTKNSQRKKKLDSISAAVILKRYLDQ